MYGRSIHAEERSNNWRSCITSLMCSGGSVSRIYVAKAYGISKESTQILAGRLPELLCIRYVDNRLSIVREEAITQRQFARFLNQLFYQYPVELEDCGDKKFLGYELDIEAGTLLYVVPKDGFSYRDVRSAGSAAKILSGLHARLYLLYRGTFPHTKAKQLVEQLLQGYQDQGFPRATLQRIAFKVSTRYCK